MRKIVSAMVILITLLLLFVFIKGISTNQTKDNKIVSTEINSLLESENTEYVLIGEKTCLACQNFQPILERAAEKTEEDVYYLDAANTKNSTFLVENNIQGTPTLLIIKEGVIEKIEGFMEYDDIEAILLGN